MKCIDCPYYFSGYMFNRCNYTESEYFRTTDNCDLINEDGTPTEIGRKLFSEPPQGKRGQ